MFGLRADTDSSGTVCTPRTGPSAWSSAQKASEHLEHEHVFGIEEQVKNSMRQKGKQQIVSISRVVVSHGLCVFSCNMGIITRWLSPFVSDY